MPPPAGACGAILVGGAGSRLGGGKPEVDLGGRPLVARVADSLREVVEEICVVGGAPDSSPLPELPFVPDGRPERAPIVGVEAALAAAKGRPVLVVGCDHPLLRASLLRALLEGLEDAPACAPRREGRPEPLLAAWRPERALPVIRRRLERGDLRLAAALGALSPRWIDGKELAALDPDGRSFLNVNTPEDLERARRLVEKLGA